MILRYFLAVLLTLLTLRGEGGEVPPVTSFAPAPRLLMNDRLLNDLRNAPADPVRTDLKNYLYALADRATEAHIQTYAQVTIAFNAANPRPSQTDYRGQGLRTARRVQGLILTWAMASRIAEVVDRDLVRSERWARRAIRQMAAVAAPDFNWDRSRGVVLPGSTAPLNGQFLNVAELAFGVAVGFDWLSHRRAWWTIDGVDTRPVVAKAMHAKALMLGRDAYGTAPSSYTNFWVNGTYNWTQVCNAGLLATALALAGEDLSPTVSRVDLEADVAQTIDGACDSLLRAQAMYQPAGVYPEGQGYWSYGTGYQVMAIAMLESALAASPNFLTTRVQPLWDNPGFRATSWFRTSLVGPTGIDFSYSDTGFVPTRNSQADDPSLPLSWIGLRLNDPRVRAYSRRNLDQDLPRNLPTINDSAFFNFGAYPLHYLWLPPSGDSLATTATYDDHLFPGKPLGPRDQNAVELAVFRNTPANTTGWWVAMKGGASGLGHSHHDLGSFVLEHQGVRWAEDLGADDYELPNYGDDDQGGARWNYLLCGTQGHNVLAPGGMQQQLVALAPITSFSSTPTHGAAVIDLSSIYPGMGHRLQRGVELIDQRQQVVIQDDIAGLPPGVPLYWRMMTKATTTVADPRTLVLTRTIGSVTRTLRLEVLHPANATVNVQSVNSIQNGVKRFDGFSRITVTVPGRATGGDAQVVVRFRTPDRTASPADLGTLPRSPVWTWLPAAGTPPQSPIITAATAMAVWPGTEFVTTLTATAAPWSGWSATDLPAWLQLDPATGRLSGRVPSDLGAPVTFGLAVTNVAGNDAGRLTLAPAAQVLPLLVDATFLGRVGDPVRNPSTGSAGWNLVTRAVESSPHYQRPFSVRYQGLPEGLSGSTWIRVTGTPTKAGRHVVQIEAQNVFGTVRGSVVMDIQPASGADLPTLTATPVPLNLP